jgi:MFS family permease
MSVATAPANALPRRRALLLVNANFRWLWLAHLISMFGDGLYTVALPWLVFKHTGSGMATAITLAAGAIPYLLIGPIAGVYVDRWDRRRTLMSADLLRALALVLFPLALLRGFNLPLVIALAIVLPAIGRFFVPAQRATTPWLVKQDELTGANALMEGAGQAAYIAGPALGGLLIVIWGAVPLLFADGATFVASALLIALIAFHGVPRSAATQRHVGQELREGFRVTWQTPVLRTLAGIASVAAACFATMLAVLPLWVGRTRQGGSGLYGLMLACLFAGALLASIAISRYGKHLPRGAMVTGGILLLAVASAALGAAHSAGAGAVAIAIAGLALTTNNIGALTLLQRYSPPGTMGRVFAVNDMAAWGLRPLVVVAAGALADAAGPHATLFGVSAILACLGVVAMAAESLRSEEAAAQVRGAMVPAGRG